jgi:hypothetical protein
MHSSSKPIVVELIQAKRVKQTSGLPNARTLSKMEFAGMNKTAPSHMAMPNSEELKKAATSFNKTRSTHPTSNSSTAKAKHPNSMLHTM